MEKMEALENLDLIFLCLDEMVDQGYACKSNILSLHGFDMLSLKLIDCLWLVEYVFKGGT